MTNEQLAWAAGFFDGEGSVGVSTGAKTKTGVSRWYLRASVAQKNRALLDQFVGIFGCGAVYCDHRRSTHACQFNSRDAFKVMNAMWPWLGEQKKADFKRAVKRIRESRTTAAVLVKPKARPCIECGSDFVPSVRHDNSRFCSSRCYQRAWKRAKRGPAPTRYCVGCGCEPDQRTRGCRRCMTRHWQRAHRTKRGERYGPLQAEG